MGIQSPEQIPRDQAQAVYIDTTPREVIKGYLEDGYTPRIFNPLTDSTATERLETQRNAWAQGPRTTVVFTSGVYDVFHANHRCFLLATQLSAVPHHYAQHENGDVWEELSPEQRKAYTDYAIGDKVIKQIVSVDGDDAVAQRKSNDPAKGNMARPIYGWDARARDVLSASIMFQGQSLSLVDAVTIHDRVRPELAGTPHAEILDIGRFIRPDVWAIYHESTDIVEGLSQQPQDQATALRPTLLYNTEGLYSDPLLGGPFSTTALARRIGTITVPPEAS